MYTRETAPSQSRGKWIHEQAAVFNNADKYELDALGDTFDKEFQAFGESFHAQKGVHLMKDFKAMMEDPIIMEEYKEAFLQPILTQICEAETTDPKEKIHLESLAQSLERAWDTTTESFLVQESYNVANYLPLSTLDFPALVKQYIRFLGKDLIPVQTMNSTSIEQRIFTKWLIDNQTGMEYEVPKIFWQRDPVTGQSEWRRLYNAGRGHRINSFAPITAEMVNASPNKRFPMFTWLLDDEGGALNILPATGNGSTPPALTNLGVPTGTGQRTIRTRLSYDFHINYAAIGYDSVPDEVIAQITAVAPTVAAAAEEAGYFVVRLPRGGIQVDVQNNGNFIGGMITEQMNLPIVARPTYADGPNAGEIIPDSRWRVVPGAVINGVSDQLSGVVNFPGINLGNGQNYGGTLNWTSTGVITGVFVDGYISNETNMRTIGFREHPEIRKYNISDGCRFQLPFTVEDFASANAMLNFNLYNRLVQELVSNQEMFEDEYILSFLDEEFAKYDGVDSDIWNLESYTHTEFADLSPQFFGDTVAVPAPYEYRTDAIHNAIASVIYELADRGKLDNLGFVVYANPKVARLLGKFVTWTIQKSTEIGGVQMNHAFGIMTDANVPIRVVASNRVDAYTRISAYDAGIQFDENGEEITEDTTRQSQEYFFKIVGYPMDKFHISYKHFRFARHLNNSPENAAYADAQNPGGSALLVTTSAQYMSIAIQGIQGRVICLNSYLAPDKLAGLIPEVAYAPTPDPTPPSP